MFDFNVLDLSGNSVYTLWQFDYGQTVVIDYFGAEINEVHFDNKYLSNSIVQKPQSHPMGFAVKIPDRLLSVATPINIYVYYTDADKGVTIKRTKIPVHERNMADDYTGDGGDSIIILQSKTVTPSDQDQYVRADRGYDAMSEVIVKKIPSSYVKPTGTKTIIANGEYSVREYEKVSVSVQNGGTSGDGSSVELFGDSFYDSDDNRGNVVIHNGYA